MADDYPSYPNSTLYRPPTQFDTDARTRVAGALSSTAANAARAASVAAPAAPPFYGYGTMPPGGAGEGGVGMQGRGYALPPTPEGYSGSGDYQGDASKIVNAPGLAPGATMSNVDGVHGAQKIVDAQGRTTYTNLGAGGYMSPSVQLPSVPAFLSGVRSLYAGSGTTQGGVPAPRYTYSRGINGDLIRDEAGSNAAPSLEDQIAGFEKKGDTQSLIRAAGLRKQVARNAMAFTAQSEDMYRRGMLDLGTGHLGVAQGQLDLTRQQGLPKLTLDSAEAVAAANGDQDALARIQRARAGQFPNAPVSVNTGLTTVEKDPATGLPLRKFNMQGDVSGYPPATQLTPAR